jgi:hypothetical protein
MVEVYLHYPISLHSMVLKLLSTGKTLHLFYHLYCLGINVIVFPKLYEILRLHTFIEFGFSNSILKIRWALYWC